MLSGGHLFLADASAIETAPARRILLYRDPYDWVIARARFFVSEQFVSNMDHLKSDALTADELLTMMIFGLRSEEHTSELQSLMRISYAVFCLKKKNKNK